MRVAVLPAFLAGAALVLSAAGVTRQDTVVLAPEASEAKARQIIQQTIQALGGPAFQGIHDSMRRGRLITFQHSGAPNDPIKVVDYAMPPDRSRTEYLGNIEYFPTPIPHVNLHKNTRVCEVHNGDEGWTASAAWIEALPGDSLTAFKLARKRNLMLLLRQRLKEPDLILRYSGPDVLDLKQVEWLEIIDADRYVTRVAIDHTTHLPVRAVYSWRDPETRQSREEVEIFGNYQLIQGIMTPLQIWRDRNGFRYYQLNVDEVKYNTGVNPAFFTRVGAEECAPHADKKRPQ